MARRRLVQVGDEIKREIAEILQRELRDPRLGFVTITRVEVTPDLKVARVYVSVLGTEEEHNKSLEALQHAKGFIRKEIAARLNFRYTPELVFKDDRSMEYAANVFQILKTLDETEDEGAGSEKPKSDSSPETGAQSGD